MDMKFSSGSWYSYLTGSGGINPQAASQLASQQAEAEQQGSRVQSLQQSTQDDGLFRASSIKSAMLQ